MIEFTVLGIFIGSFVGLAYGIAKKIPLLLTFPISQKEDSLQGLAKRAGAYLKKFPVTKWISSPEFFLQKLLSNLRILSLRMEKKTSDWLVHLRKKSQEKVQEKETVSSERYWEKLKKKS